MPKYRVCGIMTISVFTEVEAATPEAAITEAETREVGGLCYNPFGPGAEDESWITEELDGEPMEFHADEIE